jgi:hypothetical protein
MAKKSPFGADFLDTELFYDGSWNSLGPDFDRRGIEARHGASSEGAQPDVSSLGFTLKNGDGKYSPRNPSSPLYGKIGRNTPARAVAKMGAPWLRLAPGDQAAVTYSSDFVPTGDIDLRWWGDGGSLGAGDHTLLRRWDGLGTQVYYLRATDNGRITLWASTTGSDAILFQSSAPIPSWAGEIAIRVALDVNNGAGGATARFYYARTLDGPWLPLGSPQSRTGTITLYTGGTAPLRLQGATTSEGAIYGFEVRHSLDESAWPISSLRFDRVLPGYRRGASIIRTNLFHDPFARGSYALGTSGATVTRQDSVFRFAKTAGSGVAGYGALRGVAAPFVAPSTTYTVRFSYRIPPGGGVSQYWRPQNSVTGTTGQVLLSTTPLIQDGQWHARSTTFTTSSTALGTSPAGLVFQTAAAAPPGFEFEIKNVYIRQGSFSSPSSVGSAFDGWTPTNPALGMHFWTGPEYASPSVRYSAVADTAFFNDDQARYWTLFATSEITNKHILAAGEVSEFPVSWGLNGEPSVLTDVEASGVRRRLGQGEQPIDSPLFRAITTAQDTGSQLLGYWPMEDGENATRFGSASTGLDAWWSTKPALASWSGLPSSKPLPDIGSSRVRFRVPQTSVNATGLQVRAFVHVPDNTSETFDVFEIYLTGGALNMVRLRYNQPDGTLTLFGYGAMPADGGRPVVSGGGTPVNFNMNGKVCRLGVDLWQDGSNVRFQINTLEYLPGQPVQGLIYDGTFTGVTLFSVTDVLMNPSQKNSGLKAGHLTIGKGIAPLWENPSSSVIRAFEGESAEDRLRRLAAERGIPMQWKGFTGASQAVGPQPISTWIEVLEDTAKADGGILMDDIDNIGLRYRTLHSLGDQPALEIKYQDNMITPFVPVDDDAMLRNRVTVARPEGTAFTAEKTEGALSSLPAPAGVGQYEDEQTVNLFSDSQVQDMATWLLHLGTWDEGRYPSLGVDLADPRILSNKRLTRELLRLDVGDRLVITDLPKWLPPFPVDVLVMGVQYVVTPTSFKIVWTCVPARPYRFAYFDKDHRYSGEGTTLSSAVNSTATTLPLSLPAGVVWTAADGAYNILVGGEVMRVTAVNGAGNSMTVTRSVNGVVKSHAAGTPVGLADPSFYPR